MKFLVFIPFFWGVVFAQTQSIQQAIDAWQLDNALAIADSIISENPTSWDAHYLHGKINLLQKNYDKALSKAQEITQKSPGFAKGYLLEAEAYFWKEDMAAAEAALKKSIQLDPFNADARFWYGYAIWRKRDATLLSDMAAQWEKALEIDPLHYLTHWHWGNGHTHQTFEAYKDKNEQSILKALERAEAMVSRNQLDSALAIGHHLSRQYPESVLPAMFCGSVWYMNYEASPKIRLDSAQSILLSVLDRKKHYGPAHNALAAVIKAKRFPLLANFDSLEKEIENTKITDLTLFAEIFPDMAYYPGDRVQKMIWNQLHAGRAYFPMLKKLGRKFVIPPLHVDLAMAMKNNYFRGNTTFDNRQWMDIRGVGSGATGIEYVERGAHQERNVTLHEYVHLFHMMVFTDPEKRRVRQLYANAMQNGLTLDYYSANNEHEYLAQTYSAYFAPIKVHPLNHKSVNTRHDLETKDPMLFAFLDSLVKKQEAYLNGDASALASNWAQVYVSLAEGSMNANMTSDKTLAWLDTAAMYDEKYLPILVTKARLFTKLDKKEEANEILTQAINTNPEYAPSYVEKSELASDEKFNLLRNAYEIETDFSVKADIQRRLRETARDETNYPEAISITETYSQTAPDFSTYLKDRKREAQAFSFLLKSQMGKEKKEALSFFEREVTQRPQDYGLKIQYADALMALGKNEKADSVLDAGHRILVASGRPRKSFTIRLAILAAEQGDKPRAKKLSTMGRGNPPFFLAIRYLLAIGNIEAAKRKLDSFSPKTRHDEADQQFYLGEVYAFEGKKGKAKKAFQKANNINPWIY